MGTRAHWLKGEGLADCTYGLGPTQKCTFAAMNLDEATIRAKRNRWAWLVAVVGVRRTATAPPIAKKTTATETGVLEKSRFHAGRLAWGSEMAWEQS